MADEDEFGELAEMGYSAGGGSSRWLGGGVGVAGGWARGGGGGGGSVVSSPQHQHQHQHHVTTTHFSGGSFEAEDALGPRVSSARGASSASASSASAAPGRTGLYYSPPGTSYTIVEQRPHHGHHAAAHTPHHHAHQLQHQQPPSGAATPAGKAVVGGGGGGAPRGTYVGLSNSFANGRKRPISPEQVLSLFNHKPRSPAAQPPPAPAPAAAARQPLHHHNIQHDLLVRTVSMVRPPDSSHGFGICVKGGKDSGVGVYISRVEEGSVAERAGLRPGDTILEVNGTPFSGISHEDALKMLKSCRKLSMTVKSPNLPPPPPPPPQPPPGTGPAGPWLVRQAYSWMDRQGRPTSPPPEYVRASPPVVVAPPPPAPRFYPRTKDKSVRKVELNIEPGQSLGLMIRGGVEYSLGIFITGVDKDSVADRAGLMIGDQILEVNGQSFLDVTHDEAVSQLKFHKRMALQVRDVGKVPHSCTAYSDPWPAPAPAPAAAAAGAALSPGRSVARKPRSAALQMVEEKARVVLSKAEFSTLAYYQEEYAARQMTIEAFVAVLLELLTTPEKYTLLTELREVVAPEDRSRFDELVYRREAEGQRCRELRDLLATPSRHHQQHRKAGVAADGAGNHALLLSNLHDLPGPGEEAPVVAAGWEAGVGVGVGVGVGCGAGCGVGVFSQQRPCQFPVPVAEPLSEPDEFRTPSEDSGVCLGADGPGCSRGAAAAGGGGGCGGGAWASSRRAASSDLALSATDDTDQEYGGGSGGGSGVDVGGPGAGAGGRRHSSPGASRRGSAEDDDADAAFSEDANMCGYLDGLRSQLGGWTQKVKSWYWGRPLELAHKLSRSFDMKEEQQMLEGEAAAVRRHQSMQRLSRADLLDARHHEDVGALVVPDQQGNLRITVKKTKPTLGIAIEGGANTKHPLPRIINIHENGAAFEAGGLEVGQLILEVDGQKVEGMQHQDVARLIAESFARRERSDIEFLVVEAKKSNLEPKPTALIFLEA